MVNNYEAGQINNENVISLDAPGGTHKTFPRNTSLSYIRGIRKIEIAASTSRIAATLISGGRTVYSTSRVPLNTHIDETPLCNIGTAKLINNSSAIIIDKTTTRLCTKQLMAYFKKY